ncbi:WXG100 family type VII secretion target [Streptomyces sp. BBFR102]|uniref:WXG100 family type VII secretion target n=1 Tax=Streptomyces sp. BBFR102 TaxID=3448171 RepID=UPI003F52DEC4
MAGVRGDAFPALGFVPCPGDHTTAEDVARTVRRTAKALNEICQVLDGTGVGAWEGKTAEAFREKFDDEFRPRMDEARDSFGSAATALKKHADWITVAASVLGVVAIFCPVLAPLAIGLSALAFFTHAASYGFSGLFPPTGQNIGNWLTLGGDALGMVPGVGGAFKGAQAGYGAANIATGAGGGRFGGAVAIGSAIGLGAWELTD